jgi:hypothetical protein
MKKNLSKHILVLLLTLTIVSVANAEIVGAWSIEWLSVSAKIVAVGKLEKIGEKKGEGSVIYESYVLKTTEIIKGKKKQREIKFVNRSLGEFDSFKKIAEKENEVIVFLDYYNDKDRETFLHKKLFPINKAYPASVIDLQNPDKYLYDSKFNNLNERDEIIKLCRQTFENFKKFKKKNSSFKLESRVIEFQPLNKFIRYLGVPNYMFPNAKKSIFEIR